MKTYQEFKNEVLGKGFDIDGAFGEQCWDGAMYYSKWLGYPVYHCGLSGYAKDIWLMRNYSGIKNYYDEVSVMQPGDIAVFKPTPGWTPFSHIAIFDGDAGDGYGNFLGQNQGGVGAFTIQKLPYYATYPTAFRPKCYERRAAAVIRHPDRWNYNAVLRSGDIISSAWLPVAAIPGTGSAISRDGRRVYVPGLGGQLPLEHVDKKPGSDGYNDDVLHTTAAKVCLHETKVQAVSPQQNGHDLIKVNGYWVWADNLCRKEN